MAEQEMELEQSASDVLVQLSDIINRKVCELQANPSSSSSTGSKTWRRKLLSSASSSSTTTTATSDDEVSDVLRRADKLQKSLKRRPTVTDDDSVFIAVCEMKESRPGVFVRSKSPFIEIEACKGDKYVTFAKRASIKCRLNHQEGKELALFKLNGARILDEDVTIKGRLKPWTLGNYLLLMKKSPSSVKLGVGYFTSEISSLSDSDSDDQGRVSPDDQGRVSPDDQGRVSPDDQGRVRTLRGGPQKRSNLPKFRVTWHHDVMEPEEPKEDLKDIDKGNKPVNDKKNGHLTVRYLPAKSGQYSLPVTRDTIWHDVKGKELRCIGIYQPEDDGYEVASISIDDVVLLGPVTNFQYQMRGFVLTTSPTAPADTWQSPESVVVSGFKESVPLYCVASVHGSCSYRWVHVDPEDPLKFPSSPVIYVNRSGYFQCSVKYKGKPIKGNLIHVDVEIELVGGSDSHKPTKSHFPIVVVTTSHPGGKVLESGSSSEWVPNTSSHPGESSKAGSTYSVLKFSEADIKEATKDYSPDFQLGRGGFGVVYKAKLRGTNVAIKKLTEDGAIALAAGHVDQLPQSFSVGGQLQCEMKALSQCRHRNLVDLVGVCSDPPMLVYEYMEEGSLADRLFTKAHLPLSWTERSRILKDVCRGLVWLHSSSPPRIHGDIKAANVLLDKHLVAKIGDFGFSQELPGVVEGRTMVTAAVVAKSLGYSSPEADSCHLSPKSDMYSYGVVSLKTFSGQEAYVKERTDQKLIEHLDEPRKSIEGYKAIADRKAGDIAPYLVLLYYKIIENCLLKHSRRAESHEVMNWWEGTNF